MMVLKANEEKELGGHISTYSSAATLYEVGFNHFFKGNDKEPGDLIYYQGHSSPGIYARSFLEGRLTKENLDNFRQEIDGKGLSSYPHPWLMPNYWQFPTVSMGLGPIFGIYQAHILRYLEKDNCYRVLIGKFGYFVVMGKWMNLNLKVQLVLRDENNLII